MIEKERLEELIEQGATIYWVVDNKIRELPCKDIPTFWIKDNYNDFDRPFFETKAEAKWVVKMHTARTEYFKPPFELKDNEEYKFTTAKGGKMSISKFVYKSGEVQWWLSYVGTHRTFYSYQEAVEYARKLFKGEEV